MLSFIVCVGLMLRATVGLALDPAPSNQYVGETVEALFTVGEQRMVRMRGVRERGNSRLPVATDAGLEVLEVHEDHWIMEITLKVPEGPDVTEEVRDAVAQQIAVFGTPMRVRVTHAGAMTIVNLEEVKEASLKASALVIEQTKHVEGQEVSREVIEQTQRALKDMFANPETANSILLSNYQPWFAHLGADIPDGRPKETDITIPSPIGGGSFDAIQTVTLTRKDEFTREFKATIKPNENGVKQIIAQMIEHFNETSPGETPPRDVAEIAEWRADTSVTLEILFDSATGWPRRVSSLKVVELQTATGGGKNTDEMEFVFENTTAAAR